MNLSKFLYQNSSYLFLLFFLFALLAFWPGYFGRLSSRIPRYIHVHGIAMTLWCVMLILQGLLIRMKQFKMHRITGKFSYLLVPIMLVSGAVAAHNTLEGARMPREIYYSNVALMFNSLIIFAIIYGLAIYHKKKPVIHARYMICTIFPIITPLTDRLVYHHVPSILSHIPTIKGAPMVWLVGFLIADILLIVLAVWDWGAHKKIRVFPIVLGLLFVYHASVLWFYKFAFWRTIADGIMSM